MTVTAEGTFHVHEMDAVISSPSMFAMMNMVKRVAPGNAAVLISGETGTGKELVARGIHSYSLRAGKPWVDVNCAALPEHLVESELFGYEKGAFSGADSGKPGLFELADKGTLFLDEIGELEPKIQVKLLRVLDGAPYYRLGGRAKVTVDVRIVAATNQPLDQAVKSGRFRNDLFHRISQLQLHVPPLRERPEDVVALAQYFLNQFYPGRRFSFGALEALQSYLWPGNVRELRNVVLKAAVNAAGEEVLMGDLTDEVLSARAASFEGQAPAAEPERPAGLDAMERQAIIRALARNGGHRGLAAEQLGISRRTLSRKLKQFQIEEQNLAPVTREQQFFRAALTVPVTVVSQRGEHVFTSSNVSLGGIAIIGANDPLHLVGRLSVAFTIPGQKEPITARGHVVWSDTNGAAGVRFSTIDAVAALRLRLWIQERQAEEDGEQAPTHDCQAPAEPLPVFSRQ
ncbi:MAG: sigma 54-interacting transcriptional regulator [Terriglobales bacterium]|jgi:transcriptional regulator with GAF, ATPase, and Fis domain